MDTPDVLETQPQAPRLAQPYFGDIEAALANMRQVLESGRLMEGPFVERFEETFRKQVGSTHAVAVNSCTTALQIILRYARVKGQEVVVPTNTFAATANAVLYAGATPVFADINPTTFCLSVEGLRKALTPRTRAVIVVHIAGLMTPELDAIREICRERNLDLLEDCAHALGSSRAGQSAGTLGLAGAFSFYPTKIIGLGSGGVLSTDNDALAAYARSVRIHGRGKDLSEIVSLGNHWFMDELTAAAGFHPLVRLETIVARRNQIAERYRSKLGSLAGLTFPEPGPDTRHSYYKIPVLVDSNADIVGLKARCWEKHRLELEAVYDPPCHLQPVFQHLLKSNRTHLPVAESVLERQICLPVHMGITDQQIDWVCDVIQKELSGGSHD